MGNPEQTVTVDFQTATAASVVSTTDADRIVLELDSERNADKSEFNYGEKALVRAFSWPVDLVYGMASSDGEVTSEGNGTETLTEVLSFANTNEAALSKPCVQILSTEWLGSDLGNVTTVSSTTVRASRSGVGILEISYVASFRRFGVMLPARDRDDYPVLLVAATPGDNPTQASLEVSFVNPNATSTDGDGTTEYTLTVKDFCSEQPLAGARVYLDGTSKGYTTTVGTIALGSLVINSTHTLRITRANYRDYEIDFVVPEPEASA